jgi:hypothetical protein
MLDDVVGWVLGELLGWVFEAVFHLLGIFWRAYVRVLNLPILAAVGLDCLGGVLAVRPLIETTRFGVFLLGLGLAIGLPGFFLASLIAWSRKVMDENRESARRLPASWS